MKRKIRSPILINLGHVDHGKTTLLDRIRGTFVAKSEPGLITQHISASYIPAESVYRICSTLLEKMRINISIPGFLWIDSPGHEAFTTLRKRGGAIADLGILVVDINEGFKPQTDESLNFLKHFKTPFIVAATKIDRITGWNSHENACFIDCLQEQPERAVRELDEKLYVLVGQLAERGFSSERYDRVQDFTRQICIVPVSGITGEGMPDFLVTIGGLSERFLKDRLAITEGRGKGTVLEVKEYRGLGITIDVILYDGEMKIGDNLVIGGEKIITTRIKALLKPKPLRDLRSEKDFVSVNEVSAAAGIKISAPNLEGVIAGSPVRAVRDEKEIDEVIEEIKSEIAEVEIETDREGVIIKADTLGSLEAIIKTLKEKQIPIRKALVGNVTKQDVMEMRAHKEPVIFAFGVKVQPEIEKLAKDNNVLIFASNVIYRLIEEYDKWQKEKKLREEQILLSSVTRPGRVRVLPGYVFRQSKPAVFGVEILKGIIKPKHKLRKEEKILGEIREIQLRGESVKEAVAGDKVAISVDGVTIGKEFDEGDVLETYISRKEMEILKKLWHLLRGDEKELIREWSDE